MRCRRSKSASNNRIDEVYGYAYDAAGDVIQDPTHTYTYDAENRMTSANGWTYIYNGDGLQV